jgi:hypothetical protein
MSLREEMDDHNVPARTRPKIFTWGLTGGWTTASVLLVILLNCFYSRTQDAKENETKADKREEDMRSMANDYLRQRLNVSAAPIIKEVKEYKKTADSLTVIADTLKRGT